MPAVHRRQRAGHLHDDEGRHRRWSRRDACHNDHAERERLRSMRRRAPHRHPHRRAHTRLVREGRPAHTGGAHRVGGRRTAAGLMLAHARLVRRCRLPPLRDGRREELALRQIGPTSQPHAQPVPAAATPSSGTSSSSTGTASPAATGTPAATWDLLPAGLDRLASRGSPRWCSYEELLRIMLMIGGVWVFTPSRWGSALERLGVSSALTGTLATRSLSPAKEVLVSSAGGTSAITGAFGLVSRAPPVSPIRPSPSSRTSTSMSFTSPRHRWRYIPFL